MKSKPRDKLNPQAILRAWADGESLNQCALELLQGEALDLEKPMMVSRHLMYEIEKLCKHKTTQHIDPRMIPPV